MKRKLPTAYSKVTLGARRSWPIPSPKTLTERAARQAQQPPSWPDEAPTKPGPRIQEDSVIRRLRRYIDERLDEHKSNDKWWLAFWVAVAAALVALVVVAAAFMQRVDDRRRLEKAVEATEETGEATRQLSSQIDQLVNETRRGAETKRKPETIPSPAVTTAPTASQQKRHASARKPKKTKPNKQDYGF